MRSNPVIWFEIYVQDMERAKTFYEGVLGICLEKVEGLEGIGPEMWAFPMQENGPGAMGALAKLDGCPSGGNSTVVYFSCDDCAVEAQKAKECGGQVYRDKFSIGNNGFIALVIDPDGNFIGLHSMH